MLISRAIGLLALATATVAALAPARAAVLETQMLENWTLTAHSSEDTGNFRSCSMRSAGNDLVSLTIIANRHNRWFLTLFRNKWDVEPDSRFIATLNLDYARKHPIALDAKLSNEHYISLVLPADRHVLDLLSKATTARISREKRAYTFPLAGYDKAVQWVKACVIRYNAIDASKPDASIKGEDDDPDTGADTRKDKPAETPKATPKLAPGVIETKADQSVSAPVMAEIAPPTPAPKSPPASPAATSSQVANVPSALSQPPISDAAKATPMPIVEPKAPVAGPAQILLPNLMAAANRVDFKLLDAAAAPEALKRAEVVFNLSGMTGVVMAFDLPTAAAATNEVLAYDRIACGGTYSATTDPAQTGHADVLHSTSECKSGNKSVLAHYLTLSKKSGGFFVVALTSEASPPDKLADADHALFDAAIKVSGKF